MNRVPLLLALLAGCAGSDAVEAQLAELKAAAPDPEAIRVELATLRPSKAVLSLQLPGEVQGSEDALLAAPLGGRVERVRVDDGDEVAAGAVLVSVDGEVYAAQLDQAQAQLAQAEAELARLERLGDLATDAELTGSRTQVRVAEANVRLARAQVSRAIVRAPFAGTVGQVNVEVGEMASPGTPVVRLVDLDPVRVILSVSDRDVVALTTGLEARVRTNASRDIRTGQVVAISPVADLSTRSFLVEVEVDNPDRSLLPGMIAQVEVDRELEDEALVLPQDWIVTKLDTYGVYVVTEGVARWHEVTLGELVRGQVVVTEGLSVGDRVVVVGQHGLVDGDAVVVAREGWCCEDGRAVFEQNTAAAR